MVMKKLATTTVFDDGEFHVLVRIVTLATVMVNIVIETYEPSYDEFSAADLNSDGVVDVLDIVLLVNAILGG